MSYRTLFSLIVVALIAAACAGNGAADGAGTPSHLSTTEASIAATTRPPHTPGGDSLPSVSVGRDLRYRSDGTVPNLLDVHSSPSMQGGPVVVLLPGGGVTKSYGLHDTALAPALARQGAVVFVPNWDQTFGVDPDVLLANLDGVGCAVSYALAHAAECGAGPETLVMVGHSGGATAVVAGGGMRATAPIADCEVEAASFTVDGLVLWDGDWLMADVIWDRYGSDLPAMRDAMVPWGFLDETSDLPVDLVSAAGSALELRRCGITEPGNPWWIRDPDGSLRDRLDVIGALDDGCIDNNEATEALVRAMVGHGLDVQHIVLADSSHVVLSDEDQAMLVDEIMTIADRSAHLPPRA